MTAAASKRNWAELPTDILRWIAQRLGVIEYILFGAVCTSWALAVPKKQIYCQPAAQFPWVMLIRDDDELNNTSTFFSLTDNKHYRVASLQQRRGKWLVGSANGWVVTLDGGCEMRLLNPLIRAEIQLPSITTFVDVKVASEGYETNYLVKMFLYHSSEWLPLDSLGRGYIYKVILFFGPSVATSNTYAVDRKYTAIAITRNSRLAYTRAGDEHWTIFDTNDFNQDVMYYNGLFYTVSVYSRVRAWDLNGLSPKMTIISKGVEGRKADEITARKYLVESNGDILQVWRHFKYSLGRTTCSTTVKVFKFDSRKDNWIPVTSLGGRCLFLGLNRSMSFCTRDIPGLMSNCIYFTKDNWPFYSDRLATPDLSCDLAVFNLEDGSFIPYYLDNPSNTWPAPIWFMPSLF